MPLLHYRLAYLFLGVLPAAAAALSAFSIGTMWFWAPGLLAACALAMVAFGPLPLPRAKQRRMMPLLWIGVVAVAWFSVTVLQSVTTAMADGRAARGAIAFTLIGVAMLGLFGPALCVAHIAWTHRRARR